MQNARPGMTGAGILPVIYSVRSAKSAACLLL